MEVTNVKEKTNIKREEETQEQESFLTSFLNDYFLKPSLLTSLTYLNLVVAYFFGLVLLAAHSLEFWYGLIYLPLFYILYQWRVGVKEKDRKQIAHRMPFFADALANSLSVGGTLEQAFVQSSYYLKGKIKLEFNKLIIKNALGKDLGFLLRKMDTEFPNTGLRYLISLLEQYRELGTGISVLLKKIAVALTQREEADEKVTSILAAGSGYARMSVSVFGGIFLIISFMFKDHLPLLLSPPLKPTLLFLLCWAALGMFVITRITSMEFVKNYSLRPYVQKYIDQKKFTAEEIFYFSGVEWTSFARKIIDYIPLAGGFTLSFALSFYQLDAQQIFLGFLAGAACSWVLIRYVLKGMVEDELVKTIELFPDFLQVFVIGLNSGLNTYAAFLFAQSAVKGVAPRILSEELCRAKFAMECGEEHAKTWQRLAEKLPFETIIDFCEIMVVAPMHGESIIHSISQMINSYQSKKLLIVEKKADRVGQLVVPVIVVAFFPIFLFVIFAPLLSQIGEFYPH